MTRLEEICARRKESIRRLVAEQPLSVLQESELWRETRRPFARALRRETGPIRVLAEFKRASPSAGPIRPGADPSILAREYADAGASAISVVTEPEFFDGDPGLLARCRKSAPLPLLMKDFVVHEWMIPWARALGADAVLLIVAALERSQIEEYAAAAREYGLAILCEAHDESEAERAVSLGADCIGVNHRDLRTMEIDLDLSDRLLPRIPDRFVRIAESGIRARREVERLQLSGFDAILVGESLMRAPRPGEALRALLGTKAEDEG